jgi:hypothetical protein
MTQTLSDALKIHNSRHGHKRETVVLRWGGGDTEEIMDELIYTGKLIAMKYWGHDCEPVHAVGCCDTEILILP